MTLRSPCNSPASPLFSLLAASSTPEALPHGFKNLRNGPAHEKREHASTSIHQMRFQVEERRMAGIKLVEKPSAGQGEEPNEGPKSNAGAKTKMPQTEVGPRTSKTAPNQREQQYACIFVAGKLLKTLASVIEGQKSHGQGMQLQHESGQTGIDFSSPSPRHATAIVLVQHPSAAHRTGDNSA